MDGTAATYYYDAQGRRVQKAGSNSYVYGLQGEVLAEYDSAVHLVSEYVYLGGRRIARRDASSGLVYYYYADRLGTNRVMTNASGTTQQESDYEPFGVERPPLTNLVVNKYKFTGLERDTESGLDHASFRQYGSSFGRWLTPDPAGKGAVRLNDPQTWNMYAYVRNNPTTLTDPSGLDFYLTCKQTKDNPSTCQGGHVGTTDDKGKFTATVVTSASLQDRKSGVTGIVTEGGVKITTASGTYTGQFINGTPAATLQGSGVLAPFTFNITGQGSGNLLQGRWQFNGTAEQAANWMSSHGAWSYPVLDLFNKFHPNTQQYRLSDPNNPAGPSAHLSQPLGVTTGIGAYGIDLQTYPSASEGPFHVDVHGTLGGHIEDVWEAFTQ